MSAGDELDREEVLHRGPRLTLVRRAVRGRSGAVAHKEFVRHPGSVVLVPVTDEGSLVLVRNERVALGRALWELPAGTREAGEDPAACARRELEEETGYACKTLEPLARFALAPGTSDEEMFAFVARGLRFVGQRLDDTENLTASALPLARVLAMLDDGTLEDAKTVACVLLYARRAAASS